MKRAIKMSLLGLLAMGLLSSCKSGKENAKPFVPQEPALQEDYTEPAFGTNLEMVYVQGGEFMMGGTEEQGDDAQEDERPVRNIKLDGFHIGRYEVTQAQWKAVMGTTLREQRDKKDPEEDLNGEGDNYPMYYVSWDEAQEFCKRLSKKTGKKYVLPTEAMWEYAARGGNKSRHYKYAGSNDDVEVAWRTPISWFDAHPVGRKKANELGIYDMSGNIAEWCSDWYGDYYNEKDTRNPQGPAKGKARVVRGGSWFDHSHQSRVSHREPHDGEPFFTRGFRVAVLP